MIDMSDAASCKRLTQRAVAELFPSFGRWIIGRGWTKKNIEIIRGLLRSGPLTAEEARRVRLAIWHNHYGCRYDIAYHITGHPFCDAVRARNVFNGYVFHILDMHAKEMLEYTGRPKDYY